MSGHDDVPEWAAWLDPDVRRLYERAGYRGADVPGGRTALLVIDVTRGFVGSRPLPAIGRATTRAATAGTRGPAAAADAFAGGIEPREGEWICEKARASAFYGTPLEAFLRARRAETVVVCGGTTSGCIRASCVDAYSAGFGVLVAADACFDRAAQPHLANLFDLHAKYGAVLEAQAIAERLQQC